MQVLEEFYWGNETPGQWPGVMLPDKIQETVGDILRLIICYLSEVQISLGVLYFELLTLAALARGPRKPVWIGRFVIVG